MAGVWAAVLGLDRVGVRDNFFELGGDSIRGIQVIARAAASGIRFTPKQLFQHQTIAELSRVVETTTTLVAEQGPVVGPVALSPIQREFFALDLADPQHFNQSVLLSLRADVTPEMVDQAARQLLVHHDALRMRYNRTIDGAWRQDGAPPGDEDIVALIDLSGTSDAECSAAIETESAKAQAGFSLESGSLVRIGVLRPRPASPPAVVDCNPPSGRRRRFVADSAGRPERRP